MRTRRLLLLFFVLTSISAIAQVEPLIKIVTTKLITGTAPEKYIVHIDTNNDGKSDENITIDSSASFSKEFTTALTAGQYVVIWGESPSKKLTPKMAYTVETEAQAVQSLIKPGSQDNEMKVVENLRAKNLAMANSTAIYKATIWNTVFTVPIARVNRVDKESNTEAHVALFSSIGAGFGYSFGRWTVTRNNVGEITNEEFSNTFGIHVGAIYSSSTGGEETNVIAPMINVGALDVQVGVGYELGTIAENQKRIFFTFSYDIPLYKLTKKNYRISLRQEAPIEVK